MTERARHLAERVFPEGVRVRQWVLSLSFELRVRAAFDDDLALALRRITTRAIESRDRGLCRRAGLCQPRGGSVTVIQPLARHGGGSDLRTILHFHVSSLDGAYGEDEFGRRRFFIAPAPSPAEVEHVLARIVRRAAAYLAERDAEPPDDDEPLALARDPRRRRAHHRQRHPSSRRRGRAPRDRAPAHPTRGSRRRLRLRRRGRRRSARSEIGSSTSVATSCARRSRSTGWSSSTPTSSS
jgi:hypothetical protein